MYFQWKDTPYGMIRVSHGGLKELVQGVVNTKQKLYGLSLRSTVQQEDADMSIVLSDENVIPEMKKKMEEHFTALFEPMGIKASVVWATPERSMFSVVMGMYRSMCSSASECRLIRIFLDVVLGSSRMVQYARPERVSRVHQEAVTCLRKST